jgi:septal ring factor EnvC (AmiA/AmiB activator)
VHHGYYVKFKTYGIVGASARNPVKALESLQQDYNQLQSKYERVQQESALLRKALAEAREQETQAREQVVKQQEDLTQWWCRKIRISCG